MRERERWGEKERELNKYTHSQLKGKRVQRLLLPIPNGCESTAVILAEDSFSKRNFATELACNSLPLHGESPARNLATTLTARTKIVNAPPH